MRAIPAYESRPCPAAMPSLGRWLVLGAFVLGFSYPAPGAEDEVSVGATTGFTSRSIYRGIERSGSAWQGALDGDVGPWRASAWATKPLDSAAPRELSSGVGYVWKISGALSLEAWGTHFWYLDQPLAGAPAHSFEADLQLTWSPSGDCRFSLQAGHDIRYRSDSLQGSIDYDLALGKWGTFLQLRAYAGYVAARDLLPDATSGRLHDDYAYGGTDIRLPYRVTYHTLVAIEAHHVSTRNQNTAWSPLGAGSGARQWVNVSVRYDF